MKQEKAIRKFQDNLTTIRRLFGWTIEDLGNKIGVTKQTISNIENRKTEMSRVQYIATRSVFETEACSRPQVEKDFLINTISNLVDSEADGSEEQKKAEDNAKLIASTIAGGTCLSAAIVAFGLLTPVAPVAATFIAGSATSAIAGGIASGAVAGETIGWLATLLGKENKKNGKNRK